MEEWEGIIMRGEGFKTINLHRNVPFELGFYNTLPLPVIPQDTVDSVKSPSILRAILFYKLPKSSHENSRKPWLLNGEIPFHTIGKNMLTLYKSSV